MAFDLRAATEAALSEAERAPFEFEWGDEKFAIPHMSSWPLEVSATFAAMAEADENDIEPAKVMAMLTQIVGADEWDRFAAVIPAAAMPVLMEEMAKGQMGASMPDLSLPPGPASTPT